MLNFQTKPFLFGNNVQYVERWHRYIRCELCVYSKPHPTKPGYVKCQKYPYMISGVDQTCKSAKLKPEINPDDFRI